MHALNQAAFQNVLFSLLLRRVLVVAILGVTAASLGAYLMTEHIGPGR